MDRKNKTGAWSWDGGLCERRKELLDNFVSDGISKKEIVHDFLNSVVIPFQEASQSAMIADSDSSVGRPGHAEGLVRIRQIAVMVDEFHRRLDEDIECFQEKKFNSCDLIEHLKHLYVGCTLPKIAGYTLNEDDKKVKVYISRQRLHDFSPMAWRGYCIYFKYINTV